MSTQDQKTEEDIRFEQIVQSEGYQIKAFYSEQPQNFFQNAVTFPEFFNENLVSPYRVLKKFVNNPHSNIRIFYYQLLRLSYEIQIEGGYNRSFLRTFTRIVFNPEFEILFTPDSEGQRDIFNDHQFKKLYAEFLLLIENEQAPNVEQIINCFPIIDHVFIHIIRSLLATQGLNEGFQEKIPSEALFATFSQIIGLNITSYGNCWKFEDSDMFCYEQNQNELYLAFILQAQQQSNLESNSQANQHSDQISDYDPRNSNNYQNVEQVTSTQTVVINQPVLEQLPETHQKQDQRLGRQSMISETYEFVDFTNTTTVYKGKIPKQKPVEEVHYNHTQKINQPKTQTIINQDLSLAQQASLKTNIGTPPYISPSIIQPNTYKSPETIPEPYKMPQIYKSSEISSSSLYKSPQINTSSYKSSQIGTPLYKSPQIVTPLYQSPEIVTQSYKNSQIVTSYKSPQIVPPLYQSPDILKPSIEAPFNQATTKPLLNSMNTNFSSSDYDWKYNSSYEKNNYTQKISQQIYRPEIYQPNLYKSPIQQYKLNTNSNVYTSSGTGDLGDYYKDFTNSFTLDKMPEPQRSNIRNIKNRIKGLKRGAVGSQTFNLNLTNNMDIKPTNSRLTEYSGYSSYNSYQVNASNKYY